VEDRKTVLVHRTFFTLCFDGNCIISAHWSILRLGISGTGEINEWGLTLPSRGNERSLCNSELRHAPSVVILLWFKFVILDWRSRLIN
jgi:hypothetical protein